MNFNTQIIDIPIQLSDNRLDGIIDSLYSLTPEVKKLTLNLANSREISPAGMAVLYILFDTCAEQSISLEAVNENPEDRSHLHICSMVKKISSHSGFLSENDFHYSTPDQLLMLKVSSIAPEFIQKLEEKFSNRFSEERLWEITLTLNELMQNAVDHSTSERYFIYAGVHGINFEFGVLDRGVSIPAKLETKYRCTSDEEYIAEALKLKVGTRRNRPGGMGLYYLFENIKNEKGKLVIISRNGQMRRHFNARKVVSGKTKKPLLGTWCMANISVEKR